MPDRPNILVFMTDDHGQWAANCYGCSGIHSPTLDYLAHTGARMDRAFTPCAVCSPARASFFTGRIPSSHGIHNYLKEQGEGANHPALNGQATLATRLKDAGYRTGFAGKWHCGHTQEHQPGFDHWQPLGEAGCCFGPQPMYEDGKLVEHFGHQPPVVTEAALDFLREHEKFSKTSSRREGNTAKEDSAGGDVSEGGGQPFFLFVGYTDTHTPFKGEPERLVDHYRRNPIRCVTDPPAKGSHGDEVYQPTPEQTREYLAQYGAAVSAIDASVGRIIDQLDSMQQLENTLIVYTSDHGLNLGNYGLWLKGNGTTPVNFVDGSILVPCILSWPAGFKGGQSHDMLVDHCDLHATLLDAAGVTLAEDEQAATHARSYLPTLQGIAQDDWPTVTFGEYANARMARTSTEKLVLRYPGPNGHFKDEFYDLRNDPRETANVIGDPKYKARVAELSRAIEAFFKKYEVEGRSGLLAHEGPRHADDEPWLRKLGDHAQAMLR